MREKQMKAVYFRELSGSIILYVLILFTSIWIAKGMPDGIAKTLLVLSPVFPVGLMFLAIVRHFQRMDEYMRGWLLENIAIAGGITAIFSISYGFLETIQFPKLSMFVIWCLFMGSTGVISCVRKWLEHSNA